MNRPDISPQSPVNVHLMAEAMKRGFADFSAFIADPGFVEVPLQGLFSPDYARARAAEIQPDAISPKVVAGEPAKYGSGSTTALALARLWRLWSPPCSCLCRAWRPNTSPIPACR